MGLIFFTFGHHFSLRDAFWHASVQFVQCILCGLKTVSFFVFHSSLPTVEGVNLVVHMMASLHHPYFYSGYFDYRGTPQKVLDSCIAV